jgi:hypothetical protein
MRALRLLVLILFVAVTLFHAFTRDDSSGISTSPSTSTSTSVSQ